MEENIMERFLNVLFSSKLVRGLYVIGNDIEKVGIKNSAYYQEEVEIFSKSDWCEWLKMQPISMIILTAPCTVIAGFISGFRYAKALGENVEITITDK